MFADAGRDARCNRKAAVEQLSNHPPIVRFRKIGHQALRNFRTYGRDLLKPRSRSAYMISIERPKFPREDLGDMLSDLSDAQSHQEPVEGDGFAAFDASSSKLAERSANPSSLRSCGFGQPVEIGE